MALVYSNYMYRNLEHTFPLFVQVKIKNVKLHACFYVKRKKMPQEFSELRQNRGFVKQKLDFN